jgi:hypothetical protein
MRNTVMPLVMVVVVALAGVYAMRSESHPGINGPDIHPGIFRLPKKDKFHVDSAALTITNEVTSEGQPPANRGENWRVTLVRALDRHAVTRSVVLALGERLTGHGCVTIIAPDDSPSFPMGVSRVLTVATVQAETPTVLGGTSRVTVQIGSALARLPDGHPAIGLLPDPAGSVRAALTITQQSKTDSAPAGWPNWWAAIGRSVADESLTRLATGGLPPVTDPETRTWIKDLTPLADWGNDLPQPPTTERLRWEYAFQEHLVRGWVGLMPGLTTPTKSGGEEPTLDQLIRRMESGGWQEAGAAGARIYSRTHEGRSEWFSITEAVGAIGWRVAWWQERPGMGDLFTAWSEAAAKGDRGAARLLHAHRDAPVLPASLREAARTALDGASK